MDALTNTVDPSSDIEREAESVRRSEGLGRSGPLRLLFEDLVAASVKGERRSEIDIATGVFGKPDDFDVSQDATVRVYMHRLRRKLAEYYDRDEGAATTRLTIPKGEYRLVLAGEEAADPATTKRRRLRWAIPVLVALALNLGLWALFWPRRSDDALAEVRGRAPWAEVLADSRPLAIVVGDYYIFGESDPAHGVDRLVREYSINSGQDLDEYLMRNPERIGRYQDLGLTYMPAGIASALRDLMPLLVHSDRDRARTRVLMASELTPAILKFNNLIYVGYFSGLGILRDPTFGASRFSVGSTWDELIDDRTKRHFASAEGGPENAGVTSRDYGYFASFPGPSGNRVIVICGNRDMGLKQAAEAVTRKPATDQIARAAGNSRNFEALFRVEGINRQNLASQLLLASPRGTASVDQPVAKAFPEQ